MALSLTHTHTHTHTHTPSTLLPVVHSLAPSLRLIPSDLLGVTAEVFPTPGQGQSTLFLPPMSLMNLGWMDIDSKGCSLSGYGMKVREHWGLSHTQQSEPGFQCILASYVNEAALWGDRVTKAPSTEALLPLSA